MKLDMFILGDVELLVAAVGAIFFVVSYSMFFRWRKTSAGRSLMYFVLSLIVVFVNNIAARSFGDYPYREWVRLVIYATVAITIWRIGIVLWSNWNAHKPGLDIENRPRRSIMSKTVVKVKEATNKVAQTAKAWIALLSAILTGISATLTADSPQWEVRYIPVALAILGAIGTYLTPNAPPSQGRTVAIGFGDGISPDPENENI